MNNLSIDSLDVVDAIAKWLLTAKFAIIFSTIFTLFIILIRYKDSLVMDKQAILSALTPEIVEKFRMAISLGKWEDGRKLTEEQRQTCIQAVVVWEHEFLAIEERTGYIHRPKKEAENCDIGHDHHYPNLEQQPVKFR